MFLLDMREERGVAEVALAAGADEVPLLGLVLFKENHCNNYFGFY
jgi:hypothetical protein